MKKKNVTDGEIQQRDALVVARQQPRLDAVAVVQVVPRRHEERCCGMVTFVCACGSRSAAT